MTDERSERLARALEEEGFPRAAKEVRGGEATPEEGLRQSIRDVLVHGPEQKQQQVRGVLGIQLEEDQ
ncbi:MAG: hypothetical protein M3377_07860 [Actinomycetota bacterium]|nr:hypothetical protein [Actinomycetota bacterium]